MEHTVIQGAESIRLEHTVIQGAENIRLEHAVIRGAESQSQPSFEQQLLYKSEHLEMYLFKKRH